MDEYSTIVYPSEKVWTDQELLDLTKKIFEEGTLANQILCLHDPSSNQEEV